MKVNQLIYYCTALIVYLAAFSGLSGSGYEVLLLPLIFGVLYGLSGKFSGLFWRMLVALIPIFTFLLLDVFQGEAFTENWTLVFIQAFLMGGVGLQVGEASIDLLCSLKRFLLDRKDN
ncbi:MAG: hypothetical protein ACWA5Q_00085 [bacterium]